MPFWASLPLSITCCILSRFIFCCCFFVAVVFSFPRKNFVFVFVFIVIIYKFQMRMLFIKLLEIGGYLIKQMARSYYLAFDYPIFLFIFLWIMFMTHVRLGTMKIFKTIVGKLYNMLHLLKFIKKKLEKMDGIIFQLHGYHHLILLHW